VRHKKKRGRMSEVKINKRGERKKELGREKSKTEKR